MHGHGAFRAVGLVLPDALGISRAGKTPGRRSAPCAQYKHTRRREVDLIPVYGDLFFCALSSSADAAYLSARRTRPHAAAEAALYVAGAVSARDSTTSR